MHAKTHRILSATEIRQTKPTVLARCWLAPEPILVEPRGPTSCKRSRGPSRSYLPRNITGDATHEFSQAASRSYKINALKCLRSVWLRSGWTFETFPQLAVDNRMLDVGAELRRAPLARIE